MRKCNTCATVQLSQICHICDEATSAIPPRASWHEVFFNVADAIAERSDDVHTKLGCVIVAPDKTILSTGCNGLPRRVRPTIANLNRPFKYKVMEHAERNSIYNAKVPLDGATLYVQMFPCTDCARAIIQKGIVEVIVGGTESTNPDWKDQAESSINMFDEADVKWWYYED